MTLNLYACIGDPDGDPYTALVVAKSRGAARYRLWREFDDCAVYENTARARLVQKDVPGPARLIATDDKEPELWALAKERTGIYQTHDEDYYG